MRPVLAGAAARTVVVWCPDWPVVAAGGSADVPAAVFADNRVVACTAAARAAGVRRGQRRREAQSGCPDLWVLPADPDRDARLFEPVVAAVEEIVPAVEVLRPGMCACPASGAARYFGSDDAVVARLTAAASFLSDESGSGAVCRVGVADGAFAAGLAARRGVVVPPGGTPAFLADHPVDVLDRPDLVDLLHRLGITTLGDLARLPAGDVLARFGPDGALAHRLARGLPERPLAPRRPPPELVVQTELDPPVERVDTAAFAARRLAEELHDRLVEHGLACTRLAIVAQTEHGEELTRLWRHDGPLTPTAIADRVRWQLDGWLSGTAVPGRRPAGPPPLPPVIGAGRGPVTDPDAGTTPDGRPGGETTEAGQGAEDVPYEIHSRPTAGVVLLRLVPDEVVPYDGNQLGIWGGAGDASGRVTRALARVQGLLGPEAVLTAVAGGGRGPAEAVRLVPWGEPRTPAHPDGPWPGRIPAPAPATVLPVPLAATVVAADGSPVGVTGRYAVTAAPARVGLAGRPEVEVTGWAGPWPAEERWWEAGGRRRARFQVATADGGALLLALEGGRWWAEAVYD